MPGKTHCGRKDWFWLIVPEGSVCWIGKAWQTQQLTTWQSRKQEAGMEWWGGGYWPFFPYPLSACIPPVLPALEMVKWVTPSRLILWKRPQRQVCSDVLMILSQPPWPWRWPITWVTLEMEPQPLPRLGSLLTLNHATSPWTHSQQSAILRVTAFISRLHTQTPFKISTKYTNLVKI